MVRAVQTEVKTNKATKFTGSKTVSPESIKGDTLERMECLLKHGDLKITGKNGEDSELPQPLYDLLNMAVRTLAQGAKVYFVSEDSLLSTSKAASLLNVSRPYLIKLLDSGEIPSAFSVGSHRRVRARDVIDYKEARDIKRNESMKKLSSFLQEEGFYDD